MVNSFIQNTFLQLTSKTYPHKYEDMIFQTCGSLFPRLEIDAFGNYYFQIGESRTVFASHLDTACKYFSPVKHVIDIDNMVRTDGNTILGADDKAGVTLMLWLIKNQVPGLYYFFLGEEVGCLGSKAAAKYPVFKNYDRIISFDRRGTNSVITHQSYTRTCSDIFAKALAKQLNQYGDLSYIIDDGGVYTDSAEFTEVISECTNISVGYYNEHTTKECQDLNHLTKLALAIVDVEWEKLPTQRDMTKVEYKESDWSRWGSDWKYGSEYRQDETPYYGDRYKKRRRRHKSKNPKEYRDLGHGEFEEIGYIRPITTDPEMVNGYYLSPEAVEKLRSKPPTYSYEPIRQEMVYNRTLKREELIKLKNMYFDMEDKNDIFEYNYLESVIW